MNATDDYTRVRAGMDWLGERLHVLDGVSIVSVEATPYRVALHVDSHDEARQVAAALATTDDRLAWAEGTDRGYLYLEAEHALEVTRDDRWWSQLSVTVVAIEDDEDGAQ